jgi:putative ABC transport system permease protein
MAARFDSDDSGHDSRAATPRMHALFVPGARGGDQGVSHLLRDVRYAFRLLRDRPGFACVALATLALGIGANTAIFSFVYAIFMAPLPHRDPDKLVTVWSQFEGGRLRVDARDFTEWKRQATVFEGLSAWYPGSVNLAGGDRPEQVQAIVASPGFLGMMGHPVVLGRDFLEEEGNVGRDQVAILSNRLWRTRFGANPDLIGREVRIDGRPRTVVGVLGAGPGDRGSARVWLPLAFSRDDLEHDIRDLRLDVVGRLKPNTTLDEATANVDAIIRSLAATSRAYVGWGARVEPFRSTLLGAETKRTLGLLFGAVTFVLLIACANVANLLLARGAARRRELAVRASLGASVLAMVRQLVTESLVLAFAGGGFGVALAFGLLRGATAAMPVDALPAEFEVGLSVPVLLFSLLTCVLSGLSFGVFPAWRASRVDPNDALKDSPRSLGGGRDPIGRVLVVAEFALALTLLAGGGLAIRSLDKLTRVDPGFRTGRLLTFSLPVPRDRLVGAERITAFYRQLIGQLRGTPGVLSASVSTTMPVQGFGFWGVKFDIAGEAADKGGKQPGARVNMVTSDYFATFGIPLTKGRAFRDTDVAGGAPVAVVNESFVRRYLPNGDPLTRRVVFKPLIPGSQNLGPRTDWEIVGVHGDVRSADLKTEVSPEITLSFWQSPWPETKVAVRTAGEPMGVRQTIALVLRSIDPDLPMADVKTMEQVVSESIASDRFNTVLFGGFAVLALLLAAVGIYGVMSFVVSQRTWEIGVRMALGAGRRRVLAQVLREGMVLALVGTAVGGVGAYLVGRTMQGLLYGVGAVDPMAFSVVALVLLGAALVACLAPARRAASVDPMVALREL